MNIKEPKSALANNASNHNGVNIQHQHHHQSAHGLNFNPANSNSFNDPNNPVNTNNISSKPKSNHVEMFGNTSSQSSQSGPSTGPSHPHHPLNHLHHSHHPLFNHPSLPISPFNFLAGLNGQPPPVGPTTPSPGMPPGGMPSLGPPPLGFDPANLFSELKIFKKKFFSIFSN